MSVVVDNPNFRRWFKDSVMVNPDGSPQVWYHGTAGSLTPDFSVFQMKGGLAYFAKDSERAGRFTSDDSGRIYPVYLSIKNPLRVPDGRMLKRVVADLVGVEEEDLSWDWEGSNSSKKRWPFWAWLTRYPRQIRNALVNRGYDGILMREGEKVSHSLSYDVAVVFDARSVKSATANKGSYSVKDPDIREMLVRKEHVMNKAERVLESLKKINEISGEVEFGGDQVFYFDAAIGLHWFCVHYHGGMRSVLYSVLSRLEYRPAPSEEDLQYTGDGDYDKPEEGYEMDEEMEGAQRVYNYLVDVFHQKGERAAEDEAERLLSEIDREHKAWHH